MQMSIKTPAAVSMNECYTKKLMHSHNNMSWVNWLCVLHNSYCSNHGYINVIEI